MPKEKDQHTKLLQIVQETIERDVTLRKKYDIDGKFRFVTDLLNKLLEQTQKNIHAPTVTAEKMGHVLAEDEQSVYVYLYNAQGLTLRSWQNMLSPKVFYEYSVNRPIYIDKSSVEALLRAKPNKAQHAYLTVAIKKHDILHTLGSESLKDAFGNPVVKVREGSLLFSKLIAFTHNDIEYELNESGELIKK